MGRLGLDRGHLKVGVLSGIPQGLEKIWCRDRRWVGDEFIGQEVVALEVKGPGEKLQTPWPFDATDINVGLGLEWTIMQSKGRSWCRSNKVTPNC